MYRTWIYNIIVLRREIKQRASSMNEAIRWSLLFSSLIASPIVFFVVVVLQEKSSTKKTAENKWNVELSLESKVNIIKYLTKRILVISKSDTWNLICPGY